MRLELSGVTAGYGHTDVLRDTNISVADGEVVALLGWNGMGKTTVMRVMAGQLPIARGTRRVNGRSPKSAEAVARAGVAYVPDDRGVFPTLTVTENLRLANRSGYEPPFDVGDIFPVIRERSRVKAGDLSGGQKQQLAIARAFLYGSEMILIDELSQGLQPSLVRAVLGATRALAETGVSTLSSIRAPISRSSTATAFWA